MLVVVAGEVIASLLVETVLFPRLVCLGGKGGGEPSGREGGRGKEERGKREWGERG